MSARQTQEKRFIPSDLSKKRNYSEYKEGLAAQYQTDKEGRNAPKNRKLNGQELTRKPETTPKEAGRNVGKSANYKDLANGKIQGGYLTESPNRRSARSQNTRARKPVGKKIVEANDEDADSSDDYDTSPQRAKNRRSTAAAKGPKSRKDQQQNSDSEEDQRDQTFHNYKTRTQKNDSPIKRQNQELYDLLDEWVVYQTEKHVSEKDGKIYGVYFDFGDLVQTHTMPDGITKIHYFDELEFTGKGQRGWRIVVGHGLDFKNNQKKLSEFKEIFIVNICAEVKNGKEVKRVFVEYRPIFTKAKTDSHIQLQRQIQEFSKSEDSNPRSMAKFIIKNKNKDGKELSFDLITFLQKQCYKDHAYLIQYQETISKYSAAKILDSSSQKADFVQYILDFQDHQNREEIMFFNNKVYPYYHTGKPGSYAQEWQRMISSDHRKSNAAVKSVQKPERTKKPSTMTKSPLMKKGYQTEAESIIKQKNQRSKSNIAFLKEDKIMKEQPTQRVTSRQSRLRVPRKIESSDEDEEEEYNSDFKIKYSISPKKQTDPKPDSVVSQNQPSGISTLTPALLQNDSIMKPIDISDEIPKKILEHNQDSNTSIFNFDQALKNKILSQQTSVPINRQNPRNRKESQQSSRSVSRDQHQKTPIVIPVEKSKIISTENITKKSFIEDEQGEELVRNRRSTRNRQVKDSSSEFEMENQKQQPPARGRQAVSAPKDSRRSRSKKQEKMDVISEESVSGAEFAEIVEDEIEGEGDLKLKFTTHHHHKNEYDRVCEVLQLNTIPEKLPCREEERKIITEYLKNGIQNNGSSSSLYISGMPGTGKTATTLEIVRNLRRQHKFEFIHINAMSLTNPNLVYTILHENITGKRSNPAHSAAFLDEFFKRKDKLKVLQDKLPKTAKKGKAAQQNLKAVAEKIRVVLIDELDALVNKKQTLLYNLFDWPCHQNSKLLVIAIANTMDLPEKLQSKIASRMGNNRVVYAPYDKNQIAEIIRARINNNTIFTEEAIKFVAMKVSSYSGDIRRSLQVAKRALEMVRDRYNSLYKGDYSKPLFPVLMKDVIAAFGDLYNTKNCQLLSSLRKYEVLVLLAIYLEQIISKSEKILLDKVQDRCDSMLSQLDWNVRNIPSNSFKEIIKRLQSFGIINLIVESSKLCDNVFVQLFVYSDEINNCFGEGEIFKKFELTIKMHTGQTDN